MKTCRDCPSSSHHFFTWLDELSNCFLPSVRLPRKIEEALDKVLEKFFLALGLARWQTVSVRHPMSAQADIGCRTADLPQRSICFLNELEKCGTACQSLRTPFGFTNHLKIERNGKSFRFDTLPAAEWLSRYPNDLIDDKEKTKRHLRQGGFPVAESCSFWFWQKKKALTFAQKIGWPVVVKPRSGSVSRHVTTDIQNEDQFTKALHLAVVYSPRFMVEEFLPHSFVYRATVIDFDFVACVQQLPANVIGDDQSTIRELIDRKNSDPARGKTDQESFTLHQIVEDEVTANLLAEKGYTHQTVPKKGERIFLQKDSFLKLGGDLFEITPQIQSDNLKLFKEVARFFDTRLTGIDFIASDIAVSWKNQPCAILELNNLPCIELHHFPSAGTPVNSAAVLAKMFFKYYL